MARIVFDLDGTLIDSAPDMHASVSHVLRSIGQEPLDLETIISFVGHGLSHLMARVVDRVGIDPARQEDLTQAVLAHYLDHASDQTRTYPGVADALAQLVAAGHTLGLCTNKPEEPARAIIRDLTLGPFQSLVGGDTLPTRKPDPASLRAALDALPPGPEFFVGDSEVDAETAQRAQVPFLLFTEGYLKGSSDHVQCVARFSHFDELPVLIEALQLSTA